MVGVEVGEHPGQLGAEDREQRQLGVFEQGDLRARRAGRGGGLQPDPARADDHHPGARLERGFEVVAVVEAAQVVDAAEVGSGHRQSARGGAGGQEQLVVAQPVPVGGDEPVGVPVDRGDRGVDPQVDPVVGVPLGRVHEDRVAVGAALQVGLGQRWPLVGPVGLGAEQDDVSVESFGAQRLGGFGACQARADDGECGWVAHGGPSASLRRAAASLCSRVSASVDQDAWKIVSPSCSRSRITAS